MRPFFTLLIALFLFINAYGQEKPTAEFALDKDSTVMVLDTKDVPYKTKTKDSLYVESKNWFANTYKNSNAVIQIDDPQNGHIIGKGSYLFGTGLILKYTIEVFVKDCKYRLYIHNIYFDYGTSTETLTEDYQDYLKLLTTRPKRAHWKYDFRITGAKEVLSGIDQSLLSSLMSDNDKSNF